MLHTLHFYNTFLFLQTWPEEALEMVAQRYMTDVNVSDDIKKAAVIACKYFHVNAR
jgi:dynein heavy chain